MEVRQWRVNEFFIFPAIFGTGGLEAFYSPFWVGGVGKISHVAVFLNFY